MEPEALQIGGVVAVALVLGEVIKVLASKYSYGKASGVAQSIDGFAKEVSWRTEIGGIVKEQHELQKEQHALQRHVVDLLEKHDERAQEKLENIRREIKELR